MLARARVRAGGHARCRLLAAWLLSLIVPSAHSGFLELFAFVGRDERGAHAMGGVQALARLVRARWRSRRSSCSSTMMLVQVVKRLPALAEHVRPIPARSSGSGATRCSWCTAGWVSRCRRHGRSAAASGGLGIHWAGRGRGRLRPGGGSAGLGRRARPAPRASSASRSRASSSWRPLWLRRARSSGSSAQLVWRSRGERAGDQPPRPDARPTARPTVRPAARPDVAPRGKLRTACIAVLVVSVAVSVCRARVLPRLPPTLSSTASPCATSCTTCRPSACWPRASSPSRSPP